MSQLILFRFYHQVDLIDVMDEGPWTFDNHLLMLHELKADEDLMVVPMYTVAFWVQVYDLPRGFFLGFSWKFGSWG